MKKLYFYILCLLISFESRSYASENLIDIISNKTVSCVGKFTWDPETQIGICQPMSPTIPNSSVYSDYIEPIVVTTIGVYLLEPTYRTVVRPIAVKSFNVIAPYVMDFYEKIRYEYWLKIPRVMHSQANMKDFEKVFHLSLKGSWIKQLKDLDSILKIECQKQPIIIKIPNQEGNLLEEEDPSHEKHLIGYKYTGFNEGIYEISFITGWPDNIASADIYHLNSLLEKKEDYTVLAGRETVSPQNAVDLINLNDTISEYRKEQIDIKSKIKIQDLISRDATQTQRNRNKAKRRINTLLTKLEEVKNSLEEENTLRENVKNFLKLIEPGITSSLSCIILNPEVNTYINSIEENIYITLPKLENNLYSSYIKIQNKI